VMDFTDAVTAWRDAEQLGALRISGLWRCRQSRGES
jgi:hypothetical protein